MAPPWAGFEAGWAGEEQEGREAAARCASADDLRDAWRSCCDRVLGWDDVSVDEAWEEEADDHGRDGGSEEGRGSGNIRIVNLLPTEDQEPPVHASTSRAPATDPWTEAATEVDRNISQMMAWIRKKRRGYASALTPDDEAGLFQSTVASFTATTANEIESLRGMVVAGGAASASSGHLVQHRTGVVQILLERLQEGVAKPFGKLQRQRSRAAVHIWQHPLECRLAPVPVPQPGEKTNPSTRDLRFYPRRPAHRLQGGVWEAYQEALHRRIPQRPGSKLFSSHRKRGAESAAGSTNTPTASSSSVGKRIKPELSSSAAAPPSRLAPPGRRVPTAAPFDRDGNEDFSPNNNYYQTPPDVLERESAQLLLAAKSDLDAVQKMEERMVDVTALLSQFASLVAAQRQEVLQIHTDTADAKDNVSKGQEQLVEAKERTSSGRHYTATAVAVLAWLLLFFHWVRP